MSLTENATVKVHPTTDALAKSTGVSAATISQGVRNDAGVSLSTPHRIRDTSGGGLLTVPQPQLAGGRGYGPELAAGVQSTDPDLCLTSGQFFSERGFSPLGGS
jgi:hypothetical protein